jgi:hypothetical protein
MEIHENQKLMHHILHGVSSWYIQGTKKIRSLFGHKEASNCYLEVG